MLDQFRTKAVIMSAPGRLSLFHRPLKRRLNSAFAVMAAPQSSPQHFSSAKVAIETAVKTQKEEGGKDKGWPLSVKLVGIGIVAVVPPSALKYAIENDWETRNAVEKWIPGGKVLIKRVLDTAGVVGLGLGLRLGLGLGCWILI